MISIIYTYNISFFKRCENHKYKRRLGLCRHLPHAKKGSCYPLAVTVDYEIRTIKLGLYASRPSDCKIIKTEYANYSHSRSLFPFVSDSDRSLECEDIFNYTVTRALFPLKARKSVAILACSR